MSEAGTIWYRDTYGALIEHSGIPAPEYPDGAVPVSQDEYAAFIALRDADEAALVESELAAKAQRDAMIDKALAFYIEHGGQPPVA